VPESAKLLEAVEIFDPSSFHTSTLSYRPPFGPIELELVLGCRSRLSQVLTVHVLPYAKTGVAEISGGWKLFAQRGTASLTTGLSLKFDPGYELTPAVQRKQVEPLGKFTNPVVAATLIRHFGELLSEPHWFEMHTHRRIVRFCDFSAGVDLLLQLAAKAHIDSSVALHGLNTHCRTVGAQMLSRFRAYLPDIEDPDRGVYDELRFQYDRMVDVCRLSPLRPDHPCSR